MKKLLCTILTFVMLLSVFAVPVMAENTELEKYTKNEYQDISFGDGANSQVFEVHGTTIEGINESILVEKCQAAIVEITSGYTQNGKIKYVLAKESVPIISTDYTESVKETVLIPLKDKDYIIAQLVQAVNAAMEYKVKEEGYFGIYEAGKRASFDNCTD